MGHPQHHTEIRPQPVQTPLPVFDVVDVDAATTGLVETAHQVCDRALALTGGPDQRDGFTRPDREIEPQQHRFTLDVPEVHLPKVDPFDLTIAPIVTLLRGGMLATVGGHP